MDKLQVQSTGFADGFNVQTERKASQMIAKFWGLATKRMELSFFRDRNDSRRHRFKLKDRKLVLDMLSL